MSLDQYCITYYTVVFCAYCIQYVTRLGRNQKKQIIFCILISIGLSLFIGARNPDIGTDTAQYYWKAKYGARFLKEALEKIEFGEDPIYYICLTYIGKIWGPKWALTCVCLVTNLIFLRFTYLLCRDNGIANYTRVFIYVLTTFCCFNMETNIIRNGVAVPIMMISLYWFSKRNIVRGVIVGLIAISCHFTTIILIVIYLMILYLKPSQKLCNYAFFIAMGLSAVGISMLSFGVFENFDLRATDAYVQVQKYSDYQMGFRPTFVAFNTIFWAFFMYARKRVNSPMYDLMLKYYTLASALFFLWQALPFNDRMGLYSWIVIPFLLAPAIAQFRKKLPLSGEVTFLLYFVMCFYLAYKHTV